MSQEGLQVRISDMEGENFLKVWKVRVLSKGTTF